MKGFSFNKNILWKLLLTSSCYLLSLSEVLAVPQVLVTPSPFKGLNGLNFDSEGQLYVGSVAGQRIYRVDIETGKFDVFIDRPQGQADDFFFTPNGNVFYTSLLEGEVRSFNSRTGDFTTIASNIPLVDPIAQHKNGRVFVAQSLSPNTTGLFEIDLTGVNPPRLILNQAGLNAFAFGQDGLLYSPGQFTGEVIKINVDTGVSEQVATGLVSPIAVTLKKNLPIGLPGFPSGPPPYSFTGITLAKNTVYIAGDIDNSIRTVKLKPKIKALLGLKGWRHEGRKSYQD